jgi:2-phospho-L-lactate guanylyltransferase (CobY/MobA/RfbA family)
MVLLGEVGALWGPGELVVAAAVRGGTAARYSQEVRLHVGYHDSAFLSTILGLSLVV